MTGTLYGVGVGPGDPDLITLKAVNILKTVPVIAYPAAGNDASLARRLAACHIPAERIEIQICIPMCVERRPAQEIYDQAAMDIADHLDQCRNVAVLCAGDPLLYGSFTYLFSRLAEQYAVEIIPGISSVTAGPAVAGLPIATRNDVLSVIPAPLDDASLRCHLNACDSAVLIKLGRHWPRVKTLLRAMSLLDKCQFIERATVPEQHICRACDFDGPAAYFSLAIVRKQGALWDP